MNEHINQNNAPEALPPTPPISQTAPEATPTDQPASSKQSVPEPAGQPAPSSATAPAADSAPVSGGGAPRGPENVHIPASRQGAGNRDPADRTVSALERPIPSIWRDLGGMGPDPSAPRCGLMAISEEAPSRHAVDMSRERAEDPCPPARGGPGKSTKHSDRALLKNT